MDFTVPQGRKGESKEGSQQWAIWHVLPLRPCRRLLNIYLPGPAPFSTTASPPFIRIDRVCKHTQVTLICSQYATRVWFPSTRDSAVYHYSISLVFFLFSILQMNPASSVWGCFWELKETAKLKMLGSYQTWQQNLEVTIKMVWYVRNKTVALCVDFYSCCAFFSWRSRNESFRALISPSCPWYTRHFENVSLAFSSFLQSTLKAPPFMPQLLCSVSALTAYTYLTIFDLFR